MDKDKKGKELQVIDAPESLSAAQQRIWEQLRGKKIKIVGPETTEGFNCAICGARGKKAIVVTNEKGEKKFLGSGCLKTYFGVGLAGSKATSRKIDL